jgi:hypothetical protein
VQLRSRRLHSNSDRWLGYRPEQASRWRCPLKERCRRLS